MSDDMVERVGWALAQVQGLSAPCWEMVDENERARLVEEARAAIAAMRGPASRTPEERAARVVANPNGNLTQAVSAAIKAAVDDEREACAKAIRDRS